MHAGLNFVVVVCGGDDAVSKTAVIPRVSRNFSQKLSQHVQIELLQHHIKFHPDQMKSV